MKHNVEHVVDAAPLLTTLSATSPGLHVLATSRTRLHHRGKHEYSVGSPRFPLVHHADSELRFEMLQTIHEYARDPLDVTLACLEALVAIASAQGATHLASPMFVAAWQASAAMSLDQAVEYALEASP